jgi:hypothetical protein
VTSLTVVATGVTLDYDLQWRFEAAAERVMPELRLTGTNGTITVTNTWNTANLPGNLFDSIITGLGNLFNAWVPLVGEQGRSALRRLLRDNGVGLPAGSEFAAMRAVSGNAVSNAGTRLILSAEVDVRDRSQAQPFATQAATRSTLVRQLGSMSAVMQRDLNPPPASLLDPIASHGCYLGLAYNQNALNDLLFHRWQQRAFELDLTGQDAVDLSNLAPQGIKLSQPSRVHVWCAVSPRIVLSEEGLLTGGRALFAFFDDVRVCFETMQTSGTVELPGSGVLLELSFDAKMPATLTLGWPAASSTLLTLTPLDPIDLRAWEVTETNQPLPNPWPGMAAWKPLAERVLKLMLGGMVAPPIAPLAPAASTWRRPLPNVQEPLGNMPGIGPLQNRLWLELLGGQRTLYAMPVLQSALLQLVDGSGAPMLQLAGVTTPASLGTITATEGEKLRNLLAFIPNSKFP